MTRVGCISEAGLQKKLFPLPNNVSTGLCGMELREGKQVKVKLGSFLVKLIIRQLGRPGLCDI